MPSHPILTTNAMSSKTITGSCLCRQIHYELTGAPEMTFLCHCENCRKITGSMFMANSFYLQSVRPCPRTRSNRERLTKPLSQQFQLLAGEDLLKTYHDSRTESGGTLARSFCSNCGSPLFVTNKANPHIKDAIIVPAGTMDLGAEDDQWAPQREVFTKRRAEWLPKIECTKTE